ncbi:MAG TPA: CDP-diacylglycerol--serine O-phosphatidyltransferase [Chloroflexota bacterium]|nr:CDP-diacylglycerol--serine O-phosphatidyltransferase [Chloroflexota bacterium]
MERRGWKRRVARRGGLIAHVVTFTNLGCGFAAILLAFEGRPGQAVSLIFLAGVLDFFDGALARLAGHGSPLGRELDSLADLVSFGVVPALLAYQNQWGPSRVVVGLVCLAFVVGGAWRLALFNVLEPVRDFRGLPITVAGMILTALAYLAYLGEPWPWPVLAVCTLVLLLLMVSPVRFVKLSRVITPLLRRLPEAARWATLLLALPTLAIILVPLPQAVVGLGAIYILLSLVEDRRSPSAVRFQEEARG